MKRRSFMHRNPNRSWNMEKESKKEKHQESKRERKSETGEAGTKGKQQQQQPQQKQACRGKAATGPNDINWKVKATDSGVCPGVFKRIENSELSTSPTPTTTNVNSTFFPMKFWVVSDMLTLPLTHVALRRSRGQPQSRRASQHLRTKSHKRTI